MVCVLSSAVCSRPGHRLAEEDNRSSQAEEKLPRVGSAAAGVFLFAAVGFQQVGLQFISSANSGFITGLYILFVPLIGMFCGTTIQ